MFGSVLELWSSMGALELLRRLGDRLGPHLSLFYSKMFLNSCIINFEKSLYFSHTSKDLPCVRVGVEASELHRVFGASASIGGLGGSAFILNILENAS